MLTAVLERLNPDSIRPDIARVNPVRDRLDARYPGGRLKELERSAGVVERGARERGGPGYGRATDGATESLGSIEESEPAVTVGRVEGEDVLDVSGRSARRTRDPPPFEEELRGFVNFDSGRGPDDLNTDQLTSAMEELVSAVYDAEACRSTTTETRARASV